MPIEGKLKDISLTSKSTTASTIDDVIKVEKLDEKEKKELEQKLLASKMGKKLEEILEGIKEESSEENRRDRLVLLLNDFFEVGNDKDELVQRLVVDGKTYVRFAMWDESFDVELSDVLMPSLVDWYIELATSRVNSWFEDDKKITLKYEKEKEFIVKTQEELATLQTQVTWWSAPSESAGSTVSKEQLEQVAKAHGKFSLEYIKAGVSYRSWVLWMYIWMTSAAGKLSKTVQEKKDPANAALSEKKRLWLWETLAWVRKTLDSMFG